MNTLLLIELFGYLGTALVVGSMLMTSVKWLRILNMTGSIISGIYALIIGSYPIVVMNVCLILIHIYRLITLKKEEKRD